MGDEDFLKMLEELGEDAVRLKKADGQFGRDTHTYALASQWLRKKDESRSWTRFWLTNGIALFALIFAAIAAWPVIQGWFQPAPISGKSATVPPQQSQSAEPSPTKAKTPVSSNLPSEPPK
jgi:hypothetical protein